MTSINWKMIAEMQSYIFRWCSCLIILTSCLLKLPKNTTFDQFTYWISWVSTISNFTCQTRQTLIWRQIKESRAESINASDKRCFHLDEIWSSSWQLTVLRRTVGDDWHFNILMFLSQVMVGNSNESNVETRKNWYMHIES